MKAQHTAGKPVVIQAGSIWQCQVCQMCATKEEAEANARLISAAPELLDACKVLLEYLPYGNESLRFKVESILAKALGKDGE